VSSAQRVAAAERKALLSSRAELDRVRVTLAVRDLQAIVAPRPGGAARERGRGTASLLVGFAAPVIGMPRLARWLRVATITLTAYRIIRHWRR
jgi:hypothetical protein